MKLEKLEITNFRSINALTLDLHAISGSSCHIFFGINETGKSNILRAIRLLDKSLEKVHPFSYEKDCEKNAKKHGGVVKIRATYTLTPADEPLFVLFKELQLPPGIGETSFSFVHQVTFDSNSRRTDGFDILFKPNLDFELFAIDKSSSKVVQRRRASINSTQVISNNTLFQTPAYGFPIQEPINTVNSVLIPRSYKDAFSPLDEGFELLSPANLKTFIVSKFFDKFMANLPSVIFWESSDAYLINQSINLDQFKSNPSISIPLRNIFYLLGSEEDRVRVIDQIKNDSQERNELEERLSEKVTKHINTVWPEHKVSLEVSIEKDMTCEISVSDKDSPHQKFRMEQRSDGFKQFISILLSLSVEHRADVLKNKIILLDEPERSLHPSSTLYLLNELLNISKRNEVFVASHSIFMVDRKNLERHFTVSKIENHTIVKRVDSSNPFEEDVIYQALGTSIFEIIAPYMLIFEGPSDKLIFDSFQSKFSHEFKITDLKSISASGIKEVKKYVKFFDQKIVKAFVVVDSDGPGKSEKKTILQENVNYVGRVFEINDLLGDSTIERTLEDLLPREMVLSCAKDLYGIDFSNSESGPILTQIKRIKGQNGCKTDPDLVELKKQVSKAIVEFIRKEEQNRVKNTFSQYIHFMQVLCSTIQGLKTSNVNSSQGQQ